MEDPGNLVSFLLPWRLSNQIQVGHPFRVLYRILELLGHKFHRMAILLLSFCFSNQYITVHHQHGLWLCSSCHCSHHHWQLFCQASQYFTVPPFWLLKVSLYYQHCCSHCCYFFLIGSRIVFTAGNQNLWLLLNLQESQVHSITPHESPGLTIRTSGAEE